MPLEVSILGGAGLQLADSIESKNCVFRDNLAVVKNIFAFVATDCIIGKHRSSLNITEQ